VWPAVAETVRGDPLESDMRERIGEVLSSTEGVTDCWEEDREVWSIRGDFEAVVVAEAIVDNVLLGPLRPRFIEHLEPVTGDL